MKERIQPNYHTGVQKFSDRGGRTERFMKRYNLQNK